MVREGIDGSDDWGHVARDLHWRPGWHAVAVAVGVLGYGITLRVATSLGLSLAGGRPATLLIPYASTCTSAVVFGALWHGAPAASALDGFLSFGIAPLGYFLVIRAVAREPIETGAGVIDRSTVWLIGVTLMGISFALTIARGVGRLA